MSATHKVHWLNSGDDAFAAMLTAIQGAKNSIHFETYIFAFDEVGKRFRDELVRACERGVTVKILVDGLGSFELPAGFWETLHLRGGEARCFNPLGAKRFEFRNHRKLLVCDREVAFVGGFNVAREYEGDGIKSGWRDLGMRLHGPLIEDLVASFERMFEHAEFKRRRLRGINKPKARRTSMPLDAELLASGPGVGRNPFKRSLHRDLAHARDVKIIAAYFLPTWRIRRDLARVVQRGGRVQLLLAGKSDVILSQMACRSLYRRLLRSGVEIHEYNPQILHAKLIVIDNAVYVGSANLDPRSLHINYELMLRFQNKSLAEEARAIFAKDLEQSTRVDADTWHKSRTWWRRVRHRWAYFVLAQCDPLVARWQYKGMDN